VAVTLEGEKMRDATVKDINCWAVMKETRENMFETLEFCAKEEFHLFYCHFLHPFFGKGSCFAVSSVSEAHRVPLPDSSFVRVIAFFSESNV
jgi:hypothetical protein